MNGDVIYADKMLSIERDSLLIEYQKTMMRLDIDSLGSILLSGDNSEKVATYTGMAAFVITFGFLAILTDDPPECEDEDIACIGGNVLEVVGGIKKIVKALVISSIMGGVSYLLVKTLKKGDESVIQLDGKTTVEKIAEINIFYARHTLGKSLY